MKTLKYCVMTALLLSFALTTSNAVAYTLKIDNQTDSTVTIGVGEANQCGKKAASPGTSSMTLNTYNPPDQKLCWINLGHNVRVLSGGTCMQGIGKNTIKLSVKSNWTFTIQKKSNDQENLSCIAS